MSTLVLLLCSSVALAALSPLRPGPGEIYRAGSSCLIAWGADKTKTWKNVTITLMSGSNLNMTSVIPVVTGLDGTDATLSPFNWTCPGVSPYADVYFYQFTNGDDVADSAWTTRFTIASPSGDTTSPQFSTQPDGQDVPWGYGRFRSATAVNTTAVNNLSATNEDNVSASFIRATPTAGTKEWTNINYNCAKTNCFGQRPPVASRRQLDGDDDTTSDDSESDDSSNSRPHKNCPTRLRLVCRCTL
ncbi:hypothetical protein SERLA73DRAFT_150964 [Serpula lacrymans var. lacrymans S7.3]|uniref:Yeast cell wall synthesis Kre9/Knh1-like N-terminal domain-containing protein n=1 Tax=Serpula lacrymans var. lacrymans (strain S7.3) TaxID=936435 RepID=F8PP34_SERL3|nr:hypothetical protein SERLA73DRAFT_150964 [Serpula lacrymans var. lacrymans S7.3]